MEEIQQEEKKHNGNDIFHIKEKIYEMILYGNPPIKGLSENGKICTCRRYKKDNVYNVGNGGAT